MSVFLVRIRCDSIRANLEGEVRAYSFFKNEFVRAPTSTAAEEKAIERVRVALRLNASAQPDEIDSAPLVVDEAPQRVGFLRLFERHGFVFAPFEPIEGAAE